MKLKKVSRSQFLKTLADAAAAVEAKEAEHIEYRLNGQLFAIKTGSRHSREAPTFFVVARSE